MLIEKAKSLPVDPKGWVTTLALPPVYNRGRVFIKPDAQGLLSAMHINIYASGHITVQRTA